MSYARLELEGAGRQDRPPRRPQLAAGAFGAPPKDPVITYRLAGRATLATFRPLAAAGAQLRAAVLWWKPLGHSCSQSSNGFLSTSQLRLP